METRYRLVLALVGTVLATTAFAAQPRDSNPTTSRDIDTVATPATTGSQSDAITNLTDTIQSSLGPYGDPGGIREFLGKRGIEYNFTYIGEMLANPTGGFKQGATYEGRLDMQLDINGAMLIGLQDFAVHAQGFQIHGRGLSGNNTLDLFTVSNIEAYPSNKLYELYGEQKFDGGKLLVRFGQLGIDTEFFISQTATVFVSSTFGWPASFSNDLPSGAQAFPLAAPGVRLRYQPDDQLTLLAAVYDGNPAGPYAPGINSPLAQIRDLDGSDFRLSDPPLLIGEMQYSYNQEKDAKGLPGVIKIGFLHDFDRFGATDQPFKSGATYRGDNGAYGVIDQTLYRKPQTDDQGISVFARVSGSPADRNLIDLYLDGGLAFKGLLPERPGDTLGIAGAYGKISKDVRASDIALGAAPLVRDYQALVEVTYQATIVPGVTLQPDFQYIFHPGANGVAGPNGSPLRDAAVFGTRFSIHY